MSRSPTAAAIGISAAMMAAVVPFVSLAAVAPSVQPPNGFVTSPNPSWTNTHSEASTPEHRTYHKEAMEDFQLWRATNASIKGTPEYVDALRIVLMNREHSHRVYHGWDVETPEQKAWREKNAGKIGTSVGGSPESVENAYDPYANFKAIVPEHRYEGNRPSARLIQEATAAARGNVR